MSIEPDQNLLHYRVVDKLGEGGMGQVWKALDTTLNREVAIKVLPEAFSTDPERLARFEREARLLAALNHPHIAGIYGLHEEAGIRFLAMELVAGEDLAQRLARGPLVEEAALAVGRQVAEALEAAHASGIVHRDLKPANVVIDADDNVKVLDFGLAKALESETGGGDPAMSPTITSMGTVAGMIMGTAAYMSPEQARGRETDHRADIWAFGCLLYECLCGRIAFHGETISDTLAAVLAKEPTWDALEQAASPETAELVRRCLRKDILSRVQSIGDVRIAIEEIRAGERDTQTITVTETSGISRINLALAIAAAMALTATAMMALRPDTEKVPNGPTRKFEIATASAITGNMARPLVVSPDGRRVAYASGGRVWVRELDRTRPRELPGARGANGLFWSPDSQSVGFQLGSTLARISLDDDAPTTICSLSSAYSGAAWLADGTIFFNVVRGSLMSVAASGGDPVEVLAPDENQIDFHEPAVLPDGRTLVFSLHRPEGVDTIVAFVDGKLKTLLQIEGQVRTTPQVVNLPVWSPTGHLLFQRDQGLVGIWAAPFSTEALEIVGEPFLVVPDGQNPSVSGDGLLAYTVNRNSGPKQLVLVDREGKLIRKIGEPHAGLAHPSISPDGTQVVVTVEEGGDQNLWIFEIESGQGFRLLQSPEIEDSAKWSPDGREIAFSCGTTEGMSTCIIGVEDQSVRRVATQSGAPVWTPDGQQLVVESFGRRERGLLVVDLAAGGEPEPWLLSTQDVVSQRLSPSGNRIAFWTGEGGSPGYYVTTFPEHSARRQLAGENYSDARWAPDSDDLYVFDANSLNVVQMQGSSGLAMNPPRELFAINPQSQLDERGFDVMPGGQQFILVENAGGEAHTPSYFLVENWFNEFDDSN